MKILLYNIGKGCKTQFNNLIKFVNSEKPDITILLELNKWEIQDFKILKQFKKQTELLHHSFIIAPSRFNMALFSKKSHNVVTKITKKLHHGLLHVNTQNINFFITHLTPYNPDSRLEETKLLINKIKEITTLKNSILVGDLNTLSEHDTYNKNILRELKSSKKFGLETLRFDCIKLLEDNNLKDTHILCKNKADYTVPTPANKDPMHFAKLRLDYFFVSQDLVKRVNSLKVIKTKDTEQISDHYPLILKLKD